MALTVTRRSDKRRHTEDKKNEKKNCSPHGGQQLMAWFLMCVIHMQVSRGYSIRSRARLARYFPFMQIPPTCASMHGRYRN